MLCGTSQSARVDPRPHLLHERSMVLHEVPVRLARDLRQRFDQAYVVKLELGVILDAPEDVPPAMRTSAQRAHCSAKRTAYMTEMGLMGLEVLMILDASSRLRPSRCQSLYASVCRGVGPPPAPLRRGFGFSTSDSSLGNARGGGLMPSAA